MATIALNYYCDLNQAVKVQYIDGNVFSGDNAGNTISVFVMDGDQPATIGGSVSADVIRADGSTVAVSGALDGNRAYVILPQACYAVPGSISIVIKNIQNTTITTIAALVGNVYRSSTDEIIDPGTIIPSISSLIAAIDAAIGSIPADYSALLASIAADYSSSKTYPVGAYCWEAGVLKRCIVPITSAETYTAAHWTNAVIGDDLSALKSAFGDEISASYITPDVDTTTNGVTRKTTEDKLVLYGTATASRRICFLNGQNFIRTTASSFDKTLDQGVYFIETDMTGYQTTYAIEATYSTYANPFKILDNNAKSNIVVFTAPVMIGLLAVDERNYGTEENPTYVSFSAKRITAKDIVARSETNRIDGAVFEEMSINLDAISETPWIVPLQGKWLESVNSRGKVIPIPKTATKVEITAGENNAAVFVLKTFAPVSGETPDFATGWSRTSITAGETLSFDVGDDFNYLHCLTTGSSDQDTTPTVKMEGMKADEGEMLYPVDGESADETGKTDRTAEIISKLNTYGICRFAKGIFYTSGNIEMPEGSMLIGSGADSVLKMLDSVVSGSTVLMGTKCTVKDLTIKGGSSVGTSADNSRNGIEWTGEGLEHGTVENCVIVNFDGTGIYLHDTTTKTYRNLSVANCYITGNYYGIDIRQNSEFNRIANSTIIANRYGYRNRGGNNNISNCGIDANTIGIQIDDDAGGNNGHGTITGCSVNHSNHNSGYGLIIEGTGRMLVSNCNFYYSKIKLENTNGNIISGCGFGTSAGWEISGGECSMFVGCIVRGWGSGDTPVTITNNTQAKIMNCFDREGVPYSA